MLRYEISAGLGSWDGARRAASVGVAVEHRLFNDRIGVTASATNWMAVAGGPAFPTASVVAAFRSSDEPVGFVALARGGADWAGVAAPLALWSGAGEGRARTGLLRAHPLLDDNVIAGPIFGRSVYSVNLEAQRWFSKPSLLRIGVAAFTDMAKASHRVEAARGKAFQVDAGAGLRLRLPGREATLRVDYGRGLRDGADAVTIGWQFSR
jgi:hypothetical protein